MPVANSGITRAGPGHRRDRRSPRPPSAEGAHCQRLRPLEKYLIKIIKKFVTLYVSVLKKNKIIKVTSGEWQCPASCSWSLSIIASVACPDVVSGGHKHNQATFWAIYFFPFDFENYSKSNPWRAANVTQYILKSSKCLKILGGIRLNRINYIFFYS